MRLSGFRLVLAVSLVAAFSGPATAEEGVSVPKTATPKLAVVAEMSESGGSVTCFFVVSKPVWETRTREKDRGTETFQVVHFVSEGRVAIYALSGAAFHDAQGKRLSRETFQRRARPGDTILVSEDGKPVDQAYLRILKSDALILVPSPEDLAGKASRGPPALRAPSRPAPAPLPAPST